MSGLNICPIARAIHCVGCPFVKFCLVKRLFGDFEQYQPAEPERGEIRVKCPHGPTRPKSAKEKPVRTAVPTRPKSVMRRLRKNSTQPKSLRRELRRKGGSPDVIH